MIFILVLLSIAIGLAIGQKCSPKSKLHKYLMAILLPIISGIVIAFFFATLNNSPFDFWYKLGQAMVPIIFAIVAMIVTLLITLKVKDSKNNDLAQIKKQVQKLHYGVGENRVNFEMELTKREIEKIEELRQHEPEKWLDNDLELVKTAKKKLLEEEPVQEEIVRETLKKTEVQTEASNTKEESDQHKGQLIDDLISETETEVKSNPDKKEIENEDSILSKWLKTLLIIILFFGILFGLSVLTSFVYIRYVYPSKAKSDDERLIQEANANPSKAYEIAQVLFDREENGHQSEYHDFLTDKHGDCTFDHMKAGLEVVNEYCQYCIDSAKKNVLQSGKIARDLFCKLDDNCNELFVKTGVEILKFGADEGVSDAQYALGCYYGGADFKTHSWNNYYTLDGNSVDHAKEAYWYQQAANQGDADAMGNLGNAYMSGKGVAIDKTKGLGLIREAAELGSAFYQCRLGDYYRDGVQMKVGTHKETRKTTEYRSNRLREYYDYNKGQFVYVYEIEVTDYQTVLPKDIKQAQYWWKKAADNGDEIAKERLQQIYE